MTHHTNGRFPWERDKKLKMASYARDLDATRFLPYEEKFSGLLRLWEEAKKGEFEIVVVASPEILGDNYEELIGNLHHCAQAGLLVAIAERKEQTMSKFDEQEKRWEAILGDSPKGTQEEALEAYFKHLKANLQLPCEVTGTEDFRWEESYVVGGGSQQEYERLKKTQPSYTDKYELLGVEQAVYSEWMMFSEDINAHVRHKSDGKEFDLGLAELRAGQARITPNFQLIDDYAVWLVNNR